MSAFCFRGHEFSRQSLWAPVETLQERLGLKRPAAVAVIAAVGCGVALFIQGIVVRLDGCGIHLYLSIGEPCLPALCSSWVAGKDVAVDAVNGEEKENWKSGLFPLESM